MTALPAKTSFTDSSVTEGGFKTAMDSLRDFLAEQLGATGTDPGGSILRNRRNAIINGNFDLWQRGTSFSTTDDVYTADRWMLDGANGTNGTFTVTQQSFALGQTDVPYEPIYYLEWDQTSAPSAAHTLEQRIEGVRSLAGQEVTLSFYAKLVSGTFPIDIDLVQSFGTGGSPSSDNTESVVAAGSLTSSWAKYTYTVTLDSVTGKTIGTAGNDYLSLVFNTPASGTWEVEIAQVQLEKGSIATEFEIIPISETIALAERYFEKSMAIDDLPTTTNLPGIIQGRTSNAAARQMVQFRSRKRAAPSLTAYNPSNSGAANEVRDLTGSSNKAASYDEVGETGGLVYFTVSAAEYAYLFHYTADAEL